MDFLFLAQTSSISDQITGSLFSVPFARPITNKSVTVIVFLTRASITTHFCLPRNVCILFWYFLLVNYDPISQRASVLWQHPLSLPSGRHTISLPHSPAWRQYISLSDIKIYSYKFLISLLYWFYCRLGLYLDVSQCHVGLVTPTVTLWPLSCGCDVWRGRDCVTIVVTPVFTEKMPFHSRRPVSRVILFSI